MKKLRNPFDDADSEFGEDPRVVVCSVAHDKKGLAWRQVTKVAVPVLVVPLAFPQPNRELGVTYLVKLTGKAVHSTCSMPVLLA
jgi:hypothetical protein